MSTNPPGNATTGGLARETDEDSIFYGVEKWDLDAVDGCRSMSGYSFRKNVSVTAWELHRSCGSGPCLNLVNALIRRFKEGDEATELAMREWVYPKINYCMLYHKPEDPCASDPIAQLLSDLNEYTYTCETKAEVSLLSIIKGATGIATEVKPITANATFDEISEYERKTALCYNCGQLMYRIHMAYETDFCGVKSTPSVLVNLIRPFDQFCYSESWFFDPISGQASITYIDSPGPMPLQPSTSPPSPSTVAETHREGLSPTNPSTSPPTSPTTSEPSSTTIPPTKEVRPRTNAPSGSLESDKNSTQPVPANQTSLPPSLATVVDNNDVALPTPAPASLNTNSGSSTTLPYSVAAVVVGVVMFLVFVVRLRRRRGSRKDDTTPSSLDTESSYHAFGAGSPVTVHSVDTHHLQPLVVVDCPQVPVSQLVDLRILGGGGFGIVYLVRDKQHNRLLASKRFTQRPHQQTTTDELDAFVAEINLASSLSHERIVSFVGIAGHRKTALQALFEYMDGGDLKQYLDQRPIVDTDLSSWTNEKLQIAIDIADALVYLHTLEPAPVVHRDLKSRNVLLTSDKRAKLGDFGVSRTESAAGSMTTGVGTSRWVAPEVILGGGDYTTACDIYSFGVVLSELDTHRLPFGDLTHGNGEPLADFAVLELVATHRQQPSFSESCPVPLLTLAKRCLSFEPELRPSAVEIAAELRSIQEVLYEKNGKQSIV